MPAPKTTKAEVEEYDFDNWTQEDEDAALQKLNDVKHIIVEDKFVGRFADGTIVKIPLSLSLETIEQIEGDFTSPVDQFTHLLRTFAGKDVAEGLRRRSIISVGIMTERYFRALQRSQQLAFPES